MDSTFDVEEGWQDADPAPYFEWHSDSWYPLQQAAYTGFHDVETREKHCDIVRALLRNGADLHAVFSQPLLRPDPTSRPAYPGEDRIPELDVRLFEDDLSFEDLDEIYAGKDPFLPDDYDDTAPPKYGLRSVIHAILEDGLLVKPILESPELSQGLKLEHRDPQGRTLLLSACRSALGADAVLDSTVLDVNVGSNATVDINSLFPSDIYVDGNAPRTALQSLLALGADPLATDNQEKNALHHLLESCDGQHNGRPPIIRQSLRYLATRFPALLKQADRNGTFPLHASLQRLRRYTDIHSGPGVYVEMAAIEDCISDLIAAGADVHARDGRGNTALHYLADTDLDDVRHGQARRKLFYALLDEHGCAADINVRNNAGKTVFQLLLENGSAREEKRIIDYGPKPGETAAGIAATDTEILEKLAAAGASWDERDATSKGTLLHAVAARNTDRAEGRFRFLLGKGIDPLARDVDGKTARDLALYHRSMKVAELLEKYEAV